MVESEIYEKLFRVVPNLRRIDYQKLKATGYMDLGVDVLERSPTSMRIALSHYFEHESGDLIPDPDMEIVIDLEAKQAHAATFQDSTMFQSTEGNPALQGELNRFLNQWLTNIQNQGFQYVREAPGR